jgi:hypothetical protein
MKVTLPSLYVPKSPEEFIGDAAKVARQLQRVVSDARGAGNAPIKILLNGEPGIGTMPGTGLCRVTGDFPLKDRLSARHNPVTNRSRRREFALSRVNDLFIINIVYQERGAHMRWPAQSSHRIVSSETGKLGLHTSPGLVPPAVLCEI